MVLLTITDHEQLDPGNQTGALAFMLNGKKPKGEPFGLNGLEKYGLEICKIEDKFFSVQLRQSEIIIIMVLIVHSHGCRVLHLSLE